MFGIVPETMFLHVNFSIIFTFSWINIRLNWWFTNAEDEEEEKSKLPVKKAHGAMCVNNMQCILCT